MYSNNMIYQVMIKGMGGEQFTSYKLLPIRVDKGDQTLASILPEEMKHRDEFIKVINTHLKEGWKLYNGPVELEINRNVANSYAPWGYIYQAFVK
jgi:CTP-dependent riboflavin kinase